MKRISISLLKPLARLTSQLHARVSGTFLTCGFASTSWGLNCNGTERSKLLFKLAEAIEANIDELAAIEAADNGKAFSIAKGFDVAEAAACLRYYGGWADKIHGKTIEVNDSKR